MEKYLLDIINTARLIGKITEAEMRGASAYIPARIEISGTTQHGEAFELRLSVGDKKNADS